MIKVEFTEEETQALINLVDAGLRANGLNCAKAAAVLGDKIFAAIRKAKETASER